MSLVVLLILAIVWAVFLVPQLLRARAESRPADSIGAFRRQLSVLERTTPMAGVSQLRPTTATAARRPVAVPGHTPRSVSRPAGLPSRSQARKRRRDVFLGLLAAMAGSLVLGLIPGLRVMLGLHLLLDLLFVGYVALLIRLRNEAAEREMKVRFLPSTHRPEPALLLRRSVN